MFYDLTWLERLLFLKRIKGGGSETYEVTSTTGIFETDMVAPLKELLLTFAPIQSGSGDTSPSNIRPISGWDEVVTVVADDHDNPTVSHTYETSLGQTVYGGTVDLVSGVLTVDRAIAYLNDCAISEGSGSYFWYTTNNGLDIPRIKDTNAKLISDRLVAIPNTTQTSAEGVISFYNNGIIRWKEHGEMSLEEYKTYIASNPPIICYELTTPKTYQLDPQTIKALKGINVITSDAEVTEVIYLTKTAPTLDAPLSLGSPLSLSLGDGLMVVNDAMVGDDSVVTDEDTAEEDINDYIHEEVDEDGNTVLIDVDGNVITDRNAQEQE